MNQPQNEYLFEISYSTGHKSTIKIQAINSEKARIKLCNEYKIDNNLINGINMELLQRNVGLSK
jgi:hypothetical protein